MIRDGGALPIAQLEHPATRPQMGAEMYKETRWDEGAIGQALVKTAINFICAALGPDVARHRAFDDARHFACQTNGARFREFIRPLWGAEIDERAKPLVQRVVKPGYHTVLLTEVHHFPLVLLTLYERPFAAIQLSTQPVPGALPPDSMTLGLFDYRRGTHRILRANRETEDFMAAFTPMGWSSVSWRLPPLDAEQVSTRPPRGRGRHLRFLRNPRARWCRSWCRLSGEKGRCRGKPSESDCAPTVENC